MKEKNAASTRDDQRRRPDAQRECATGVCDHIISRTELGQR